MRGQDQAKRALEIAAAGGHNLLMVGPPGSGKTMLARAFCSLLPDLDGEESLEVAALYSLRGALRERPPTATRPPFRAPHHSVSRAGLIGDVVIDAKQGVSGAGRGAGEEATHLSMAGENILPYNVAAHRHTPEIEEQLSLLGAELRVQFQAHLVPLAQGELASCYVTPTRASEKISYSPPTTNSSDD